MNKKQLGVTLIEVLIAVLIVGVGLLGLAGMQARAIKNGVSNVQRSEAIILSYQMLDMLRLDRNLSSIGSYNGTFCTVGSSPSTLQDMNINLWLSSIKGAMSDTPSSCGEILCNTNTCSVRVLWNDSKADGGDSNAIFELVTHL